MNQLYILGEGKSVAGNYDAARMQARELARLEIAGSISSEATSLIDNMVGNKQLENEDAASMTETVMASKNLISQSIGRVIMVVECYRVLSNKNREVMVRIAYNGDMAKAAAKKAVRDELEKKGGNLHKQLDEALGF